MQPEPDALAVFLPNWVGDAVMCTPALRALRARFASARLVLVGRAGPLAAVTPNPWSSETIADDGRFLALAGAVRRGRFDLAVLGPNSFRVAAVAFLAGVRRRAGYRRDGRGWLLTDRLEPPRDAGGGFAITPALDYYLKLAEHLGADGTDRRMQLDIDPQAAAQADGLLKQAQVRPGLPIVFLNPGAAFGGAKIYPAGRFAAVADALAGHFEAQVIINAGPKERAIAEAVEAAMNHAPLLNLAKHANNLQLVKALVQRSDLMLTNDTGPRHFAAALGVPVVTIFGATHPGWTTLDYEKERIVRVDVPCGPCQRQECPLKEADRHQCMLKLPPEMVQAAAEELLNKYWKPTA